MNEGTEGHRSALRAAVELALYDQQEMRDEIRFQKERAERAEAELTSTQAEARMLKAQRDDWHKVADYRAAALIKAEAERDALKELLQNARDFLGGWSFDTPRVDSGVSKLLTRRA